MKNISCTFAYIFIIKNIIQKLTYVGRYLNQYNALDEVRFVPGYSVNVYPAADVSKCIIVHKSYPQKENHLTFSQNPYLNIFYLTTLLCNNII